MELISEALDNLYGSRIEPIIRKKGELQCIGFYADFPDDSYIPGVDILGKTASLLGGILLSPITQGGVFREDYVEGERTNLVDDIRSVINDKRGYSINRLLEEMCAEEAFGVSRLGFEKEALEITPENLYTQYRELITNSRVEVFYCGSASPQRVESALLPVFNGLPEHCETEIPKTDVILSPAPDAPKRFFEALDIAQGKLAVGYRLGKAMMETPDYASLMVFNTVFGSGDTSKLFLNVRERLSLCYSVGSMVDKHKGVMVVASGVDFTNFEITLDEIDTQLEHVKAGRISEQELTSAKRCVVTALKLAMDRPGGLEEFCFDSSVSAIPYDPDELCVKIENVTADDIIKKASDITTDSIFFLTGKERDTINES